MFKVWAQDHESKKNHICPGKRKCHICKEIVGPDHQCYNQKYVCQQDDEFEDEEENKKKSQKFIFYDFESTQKKWRTSSHFLCSPQIL